MSVNRKNFVYRPRPTSLESLAVSRGIVESPAFNHPLVEKLRLSLSTRGTDGSGFCDLQRRFYAIDRDGSRTLFLDEFKIAFQRCNLNFNDQEITTLFYLFDENDKKYVDYEEFLISIRGPISDKRRFLIEKAFQQLDVSGRGLVDPEEVIDRYDPTNHPDVKTGLKKAQEVFRDFLRSFDVSTEVDGKITRTEFENYYLNLSASIERDEYFEQTIINSWRMSGLDAEWEANYRENGYRLGGRYNDYSAGGRPRTIDEIAYGKESSRNYSPSSPSQDSLDRRTPYISEKSRYVSGPRGRSASPGSRQSGRRSASKNKDRAYNNQQCNSPSADRERFEREADYEVRN